MQERPPLTKLLSKNEMAEFLNHINPNLLTPYVKGKITFIKNCLAQDYLIATEAARETIDNLKNHLSKKALR